MPAVRVAALKAHLSEHLRAVQRGATVTVLDRDTPIALIVPLPGASDPLDIAPATRSWSDLTLPAPHPGSDIVSVLREERGDR
jgi:antitoxin (DNA-binding transcriptional repressor) of toxin-antitoxin stability system